MNLTKHTILPLLAAMLTLFIACSDEEAVSVPGTETGDGLRITLALSGKQPLYAKADKQTRATTIEGENSLNENTVSTVHFFLFNPTTTDGNVSWTFEESWSFPEDGKTITQTEGANDADDGTATPDYYPTNYFTLKTGQAWRDVLGITLGTADTEGSRLYAIANLPEGTDVSGIDTWDKFCEWAVTDTLIQRKYTDNSTEGYNSTVPAWKAQLQAGKRFLMDGYYEFTEAADKANNSGTNHQVTVDLRRAAAKVRVNIYKATSWKYNDEVVSIDMEKIEAKLSNYATTTKVVTPESGEGLGDNGHVSTYAPLEAYDRDLANPSGKEYLRSVLFYTFAHDWSGDVGHETTFIMNLPYTSGRDNNWYKIVFVPDGGQRYERNTFYEVDVTVAYDGSVDSYEPSPIKNPVYKVSEWYPEEFDVENTSPVDYLILDKYFIDMRNEADEQITFYSSNKVTVEVVHDVADEIAALKAAGEEFPWPEGFESGDYIGYPIEEREQTEWNATIAEIPGIYYPDKESRRIPIYYDKEKGSAYANTTNSSADTYYGLTEYNTDGTGTYDDENSEGEKNFSDLNKAGYLPVTVKPYTNRQSAYSTDKEKSEVYITWPADEHSENGRTINLYSAVPRNATLRFITLKVRMKKLYISADTPEEEQYITRYVIIKQYPLVYVVNQYGLYSLMDGSVLQAKDVTQQDHYIIDFANESLHQDKKNDGFFQLYCGDMEAWKDVSNWVTVPDNIVYGTYKGTPVKVYGTDETTFKYVTETTDGNGVVTRTQTTKRYSLTGNVSHNPNMKCKFYLDGTNKSFYDNENAWEQHQYNDVGIIHHGQIYQINSAYDDKLADKKDNNDNIVGLDGNGSAYNNRMYEVRITATSSQYRIGYPKTLTWIDENGNEQIYADPSEKNNQLVSPHFVFASQLGNASATPYWEMAQDHCMHYVEVDNQGNVYKDWRLPTIAELSTIKQFQQDENIFNVTMNRILNSDGETNPCYWTAGQSNGLGWYVDTQGAGGAIQITDSGKEKKTVGYGVYGPWLYNTDGSYQLNDDGTKKANHNQHTAAIYSSINVRIRCVRDIKGE